MKSIKYILISFSLLAFSGCGEDFLETEIQESISDEQIESSPAATGYILNGIYASLRTFDVGGSGGYHTDYGHMSAKIASDLMGQDVTMAFNHWYGAYHAYTGRVQTSGYNRHIWLTYYSQVRAANIVINAIPADVADPEIQPLLGQALALRGLFLHMLVRFYAEPYSVDPDAPGIPLYDGSSFAGAPRTSVGDVYDQIVSDLTTAVGLLDGFSRSSKEVVDFNVANGFLARVYLDMENWAGARDAALAARTGYSLAPWDGFSNLPGNAEAMWGSDINAETSTVYASFFSHFGNTTPGYTGALGVYKGVTRSLYDQIPLTDTRRDDFVDPVAGSATYPSLPAYANLKFIDNTFFEGDYIYMRASEMYLIEAEARAMLSDATAADVLFELVSYRDPGYTTSTATGTALRDEIVLQRRIELWGEGVSFFDLKRLGLPSVRDYPGSNHATFALDDLAVGDAEYLIQIPLDEINANDEIPESIQNP